MAQWVDNTSRSFSNVANSTVSWVKSLTARWVSVAWDDDDSGNGDRQDQEEGGFEKKVHDVVRPAVELFEGDEI